MNAIKSFNLSNSQLINYMAVDLAEIFVIDPSQNEIDEVEKLLKEYQKVISKPAS